MNITIMKKINYSIFFSVFTDISDDYNDKYEYILPEINFNKNIYSNNLGMEILILI